MLCFRCGSHNPDGSEFCSKCGQGFIEQKQKGGAAAAKPIPREGDDSQLAAKTVLAERYEIKSVLGSGPTGVVYRAFDLEIEVDIAIKLIHPQLLQSREDKKHFLSAIRTARRINHPYVVKLYDEDEDDGRVFVTMQLLEGLSLRKIIRLRQEKKQVFAPKEIEPIVAHVCQALEKGHETTIHGDCKPENIIVLPDMLKVTDFGLLSALPRKPFVAAQQAAAASGAYLAPEIRSGTGELSPATDIYSLAVIILEMVTGTVPQEPSGAAGGLPAEFASWQPALQQALEAKPERRQETLREFFEQLHAAGKSVTARPSTPPRPAPSRPPSKKPAGASADKDAYPPTVIDAQTVPGDADEPLPEPAGDDERLADIAAAAESEEQILDDEDIIAEDEASFEEDYDDELAQELQDVDDFIEEPLAEEEADDEFEEGETLVSAGTPVPAQHVDPNAEARVARPVGAATAPPARKRTAVQAQPPTAGPPPAAAPSQPQAPAAQAPVAPSPVSPAPGYGPFSQPPFPPSFVTQPPAPSSSRAPVYVFLTLLLAIVGVGVYFLVDYLKAQTELARAQAQATLQQPAVVKPASVSPAGPEQPAAASTAATAAQAATKQPATAAAPQAGPSAPKSASPADAGTPARQQEKPVPPAAEATATPAKKPARDTSPRVARASRQETRRERSRHSRRRPPSRERSRARAPAAETPPPAAPARASSVPVPPATKLPAVEEVPLVASKKPTPTQPPAPAAAPPPAPTAAPTPTPSPAPPQTTAAATPAAAPEQKKCPPGMIHIPAGSAAIGSSVNDPMRNFGELKLHRVQIGAFCIDRYEYPNAKGRIPMTSVSWKSAARLCRKRGKRLCTEEEWEYACKGASNRSFPYGNQWDADRCNTEDASGNDRAVAAAGSFPKCRSPFGVIDLSGNVSEWTASPFSQGTAARAYKGGSAARPNWAGRCAARSSAAAGMRKADLGFRCCADPR